MRRLAGMALTLALAACGGTQQAAPAGPAASSGGDALSQLYQAAKQEGALMVSVSWQDDQWVPLEKAFSAKYAGIKVERLEISPYMWLERITTEKAAGKVSTDLAGARLSEMKQVVERDLAEPFDYAGVFGVKPEMIQNENRYVVAYHNASLVTRNTKLVDDASAPKSWDDLADPRWQGGKIILAEDADDVFWGLAQEWGKDKALEFARKIHDQKPRFSRQSSETTNLLIAGDAPLAMSVNASSVVKYAEQGAPIKATGVSPVTVNNNGVWVLKDAKHPNAAKLMAGWLATPEAQKIFDSATHRSVLFPGTDTGHAKMVRELGVKLVFEDPAKAAENAAVQKQAMSIVLGKR